MGKNIVQKLVGRHWPNEKFFISFPLTIYDLMQKNLFVVKGVVEEIPVLIGVDCTKSTGPIAVGGGICNLSIGASAKMTGSYMLINGQNGVHDQTDS